MPALHPGQIIKLNDQPWSVRQLHYLAGNRLALEVISITAASQGMVRRLTAVQIGPHLFIGRQHRGYWQTHLETGWDDQGSGPTLNWRPATALDLIDAHTGHPQAGDLINRFSWSYSRDALYRHCPRAYYYHYYGSWNGWNRGSPAPVQRLYLLKNLTSIGQWIGTLARDAIKTALVRLADGRPVIAADLVNKMRQRARNDFENSRSGRFQAQPGRFTAFQEHYYQESAPSSVWTGAWDRAEQTLLGFLASPLYAHLSRRTPDSFLEIGTLQSFALAGYTVWVQPALIVRENETITIYDWKTGEPDPPEKNRQLAVHGLFVRRHWPQWVDLPLKGVVVYLAKYGLNAHDLTADRLAAAQTAAEDSIRHLRSLLIDQAANLAQMHHFPMIDDLAVCHRCRFREMCGRR